MLSPSFTLHSTIEHSAFVATIWDIAFSLSYILLPSSSSSSSTALSTAPIRIEAVVVIIVIAAGGVVIVVWSPSALVAVSIGLYC
jgi:hypothetical protein